MENFSLIDLLKMMHTKGASDVHLKADTTPAFRIKSEIVRLKLPKISPERLKKMIYGILSEKEIAILEEGGNFDTAIGIPRIGRFRINIFVQRGTLALVGRRIPFFTPDFESLNLPPSIKEILNFTNGLVLVTGATGSGKSTTLAAMVNHINKTKNCHILCIEDPIEFLYQDEKSIINQREVGIDVKSFRDALKYAMREDPDVILIGEMRDPETVEFALTGAETGHLVFGTLHSSNAAQTIIRILNFFPQDRHPEIRKSLSLHLKAVVCQMLLPSCQEEIPLVPASEILLSSPIISKLISEGQYEKIIRAIKSAKKEGMLDFETSLFELVNKNFITKEVALEYADNPDSLGMKFKGIFLSEEGGIIA
ncbi:MAG: PilT/PilU family type 4a pilus ATPase [Candidatus Omnitrophota bacterium]